MKLLAALSPGQRDQAARLHDRFMLDMPAWYQHAETPFALAELTDAVLADRQVQVRYRRWDEPREVSRLLNPYGLVVKNGTWYLVAAAATARQAPRTYRVSNILELTPTDKTFERPAGFNLGNYWRDHLDDFDRRRITGTARVRVAPGLRARLADIGDTALRTAADAGQVEDSGWTIADLPMESPGWLATRLIGYGGDIEIVEPDDLRSAIRALATAALDRHRPHPHGLGDTDTAAWAPGCRYGDIAGP